MEIKCTACEEIVDISPEFAENGVTDDICVSLQNDTGLNPDLEELHDNCEDLDLANDCLIGRMDGVLETVDTCDWKAYMHRFVPNLYTMIKSMLCSMCGLWTNIHDILAQLIKHGNKISELEDEIDGVRDDLTGAIKDLQDVIDAMGGGVDVIPVIKRFRYTVAADKFIPSYYIKQQAVDDPAVVWFGGSPLKDESFITIPITEMDTVTGVWAQPLVVGEKAFMQTVADQTYQKRGNNLIVNFDSYEFIPNQHSDPYDLPIDFLVLGTKRVQ